MGAYIKWNDIVNRYSMSEDVADDNEMDATYIQYAEATVEGRLAGTFTVPFSSNNITVKDLCIDLAYAKMNLFKDDEKAEKILTHVNSQLGALVDGNMHMITDSGALFKDSGLWSESQDYTPTFGMGDEINFEVDSGRIYDEEIARDG